MKHVTILGFTDTSATIVSGTLDIFHLAGRMWNAIFNEPMTPFFEVDIVSVDGRPIRCLGDLYIQAHAKMEDLKKTDLLLLPSIKYIDETLAHEPEVIPWIKKMYKGGALVAAICTGTFVLAETGLLDGLTATTHWGVARAFQQRYPKIHLKPERLITESGNILTAGGSNACFDISLYLVRKYCGHEVARKLAKTFLHDMDRISQSPWIDYQHQHTHTDKPIRNAQKRLENHYEQHFSFDELAREMGMSRRTFERRFKRATGDSPLQYLHRVRVEAAKKILETEDRSFDEIVYAVGYEDRSFFRKVFTQMTGLSPKQYRQKWGTPMETLVTAG